MRYAHIIIGILRIWEYVDRFVKTKIALLEILIRVIREIVCGKRPTFETTAVALLTGRKILTGRKANIKCNVTFSGDCSKVPDFGLPEHDANSIKDSVAAHPQNHRRHAQRDGHARREVE
jgi:hypothetical protein